MASNTWIKLYHEILSDPKMGMLSDRLYRRCIELFLLAGESNQEGKLPDLRAMAWKLRQTETELEQDLVALSEVGIIVCLDGVYIVKNFAKRQAPVPASDRYKQWQERQTKMQYYGNDTPTEGKRNSNVSLVDTDIDIDTDKEEEEEGGGYCYSDAQALSILTGVTGFTAWPSREREERESQIQSLIVIHRINTTEYLRPFYREWLTRNYRKTNLAWLDWAITGEIPPAKGKNGRTPPNEPASFAAIREYLADIEGQEVDHDQ